MSDKKLLQWKPVGRAGKVSITFSGFTHTANVADADKRDEFARRLCERFPAIDADRLRGELEDIAAEVVEGAGGESQSAALVELATCAELFHDPEGEAYATVPVKSHRETYRVAGKRFKQWLSRRFYQAEGKAPSGAMDDALVVLIGKAIEEGPERKVFVRLAPHGDSIYLDLADDDWRAVEITNDGWRVVDNPPVKFIRPRGVLRLPAPVTGGSVDELFNFVNVPDDERRVLVKAFMLGSLNPKSKYPILAVSGEHGSAKSTTCKMIKATIDPNHAELRSAPRDERDLMIAATNGWMIAYDNLSVILGTLSDSLCRLSTGGGFAVRALFTDGDEKLFNATRPIIFNGIEELGTRPDLLDRTITISLPAIPPNQRRPEQELWDGFNEALPRILGALLDAVSEALRSVASIRLSTYPRMADFAKWVVAGTPKLGITADAFLSAYAGNQEAANELAIESSAVGPAILGLMHAQPEWQGTAKELLAKLETHHSDERTRSRSDWPENPKAMSGALRRLAPNLRRQGVEVELPDERNRVGKGRRRVILLRRAA